MEASGVQSLKKSGFLPPSGFIWSCYLWGQSVFVLVSWGGCVTHVINNIFSLTKVTQFEINLNDDDFWWKCWQMFFLVPWSSGSRTGLAILNTLSCDPLQYSKHIDNLLRSVLVRVSFPFPRRFDKTQGYQHRRGGSTKYKIPGRAHKTGPVVVGLLFPIWGSLYCNTVLWLQIENGWISLLSWVSWWRHLQNYVDEASIPSFASQSVSLWARTLKISF